MHKMYSHSILIFFVFFIYYYFQMLRGIYFNEELIKTYGPSNYLTIDLARETTYGYNCGGLGNMMWRLISLTAIGEALNRTIYFEKRFKCLVEYKIEFAQIFKNNSGILKLMDPMERHVKYVKFASNCCKFEQPTRLIGLRAKIVKISGHHLQSFKYFNNFGTEWIVRFFDFTDVIKAQAANLQKNLFGNKMPSKYHNLCVQTRRGEFVALGQATNKSFTEKAIAYITNHLHINEQINKNISITLFGEDTKFIEKINVNKRYPKFVPLNVSRAVTMCFARWHCDSMLLTAPTSTFAWWMAYLMQLQRPKYNPVFYELCQEDCRCRRRRQFSGHFLLFKIKLKLIISFKYSFKYWAWVFGQFYPILINYHITGLWFSDNSSQFQTN